MIKRTVVIRKNTCNWQPNTKRKDLPKPKAQKKHVAGFINPVLVVLAAAAFSGLFYIYSVNQTAVKGVAIRDAEKEVDDQQTENESLKIREAELESLYTIQDTSSQLNLAPVANAKYLEESPTVAYNTAPSDHKN